MSQLSLLTKQFTLANFGINRRKQNQKSAFGLLAFACIFFAAIASVAYYFAFKLQPQLSNTIILMTITGLSMLTVVTTFFQMQTTIFKCADFDFIAVLPVRNRTVVFAKFLSVLIINLFIDLSITIPLGIFYAINKGTLGGIVACFVGGLTASLIPLLFTTVVGAIVALITANIKHPKEFSIALYVIFFMGFSVGLSLLISNADLMNNISKYVIYLSFLQKCIVNNDWLSLAWYVLINVGAFIIILLLMSLLFTPLNRLHGKSANGKYVAGKDNTQIGLPSLLFKKEVKLVLSNPTFLLSSYVSPLIFLVMGVISFFTGGKVTTASPENLQSALNSLNFIEVLFGFLLASISTTTYAAFSMEGMNFELLFAYPIKKNDIIKAKLKAGIIPLFICYVIAGVVLVAFVGIFQGFQNIPYYSWINVALLPALASIMTTLIGALCGLKWIKWNAPDPTVAVKKGAAMGFTMLFSIIINIGIFVLFLFINNVWFPNMKYLGASAAILIYAVLYTIFGLILYSNADKLFNKALIK